MICTADFSLTGVPQLAYGFIDTRFVREIEQSGVIDQLYAQTR